jgi:hypothetical protein
MRASLKPILFNSVRYPLTGIAEAVAAAYSVRRLSRSYNGPLVRIKDATTSATRDFYGTKNGLTDQSEILAFLAGHVGRIVTWYDQSGNGRDLLETGLANTSGPLFAANVVGSIPVLQFSNLGGPTFRYLQVTGFTLAQPWTFVTALNRISVVQASFENIFDGGTADKGSYYHQVGGNCGLYAGSLFGGDTQSAIGSWGVISGRFNGASSTITVDNNAQATGNPGNNTMDGLTVGTQGGAAPSGARYTNMYMGELMLFSGVMSAGSEAALHAKLRSFWGTP